MAGRMSVPVGTIIFTGAFATRSSTCARCTARASAAADSSPSASDEPKRSERTMFSTTRANSGESYEAARSRNASSRFVKPSDQACWAPTHARAKSESK